MADRVLGVQVGVPDLKFADESFDAAYSTTALEMIRGFEGEERYRECLSEILRVLRPGALFGMGEPMHLDAPLPADLDPLVSRGTHPFKKFLATADETATAFRTAGFEVDEVDYAPDAQAWWDEFRQYDPGCRRNPEDDPRMLETDGGRWISFGYVIAKKPG